MRFKGLLTTLAAAVLAVSICAIPANAASPDTSDTTWKYTWSDSAGRYQYTPTRQKGNTTPVYIKTVEYTLPYNGYYASTYYGYSASGATYKASTGEYWIGNYTPYTIRANATSVSQADKYVRIRGHYTDKTYTWGDCTIKWSPDTANPSKYASLN